MGKNYGMFVVVFVYDSYLCLRDVRGREVMIKYFDIK